MDENSGQQMRPPHNAWDVHRNMFIGVNTFLAGLNLDPSTNALYNFLHILIWHEGRDPVRWIDENRDLVRQLAQYEWISDVPGELLTRCRLSARAT